jgi:3-hydroxyacyl-[acyl-carrier-protein] dehydratase
MLDRVLELEYGKKVVAIKNITINEEFFAGHFPERPILPGVLIIEAMAQAAILLFYKEGVPPSEKKMAYYLGAVKVKFTHPVFPGDQLKITIEPIKLLSGQGLVNAVAQVGDKEVARGEISFSIKENG